MQDEDKSLSRFIFRFLSYVTADICRPFTSFKLLLLTTQVFMTLESDSGNHIKTLYGSLVHSSIPSWHLRRMDVGLSSDFVLFVRHSSQTSVLCLSNTFFKFSLFRSKSIHGLYLHINTNTGLYY
jgi:hypothetical protein